MISKLGLVVATAIMVLHLSASVLACGCYGQGSCNVAGTRTEGATACQGMCDCCPVCNSCSQLFAGCLANHMTGTVYFQPLLNTSSMYDYSQLGLQLVINVNMGSYTVEAPDVSPAFLDVCVTPALPTGVTIAAQSRTWVLSGTPTETLPWTTYTIITKGDVEMLNRGTFRLSVAAASNCNTHTCAPGAQACIDTTHYHTCVQQQNGGYGWLATSQSCAPGTTCHASSGTTIACS